MLILSWNIAGLSTTVHRIHDNYSTTSQQEESSRNRKKKSAQQQHPAAALASYFGERHHADIVCLQEHKISKSTLTNRMEPRQAATIPGYESFWSCCVDEAAKGLNGVVTYARNGLTVAADAAPLGSPELDQQGRCVRTDHGDFCLFNVYVPNASGPFKMKFLRALRRAMQEQRSLGKSVILVGDLNISLDSLDIYWKNRIVYVNDILEEAAAAEPDIASGTDDRLLPAWKRDVARHWSQIAAVMESKEVVATTTTNTRTSATYNKFRLAVTITDPKDANNSRRVFLGNHEITQDDCLDRYELSSQHDQDEETGETVQWCEENAVRVEILAELMSKIAGVHWSEELQREIADQHGVAPRCSPTRQWLNAVLHEDDMMDAFRHFYPIEQARFTCWNQNKNRRYVNAGSRIDYTLIDRSLLPHLQEGTEMLRCCCQVHRGRELSEEAALCAATANGRFEPVSYEGGGMVEAPQAALDTQFGPPHTGHVYTPPTFSDHVGVSVLLDDAVIPLQPLRLQNNAATRKAQPHKRQTSIASFFQAGAPTKPKPADGATNKKSKVPRSAALSGIAKRLKKPPANSVLHHFRPKAKKASTD